MELPPSNECNMCLEIYACKILFACAILELHMGGGLVVEDELECAQNILHHIRNLYDITVSPSPSATGMSRERGFYKRDVVPVFPPYARHMYTLYENNMIRVENKDVDMGAVSGAGE